jgi:hypothetical protein
LQLATHSQKEESFRRGWEAFFNVPWPLDLEPRPQRFKVFEFLNALTNRSGRYVWSHAPESRKNSRYFLLVVFFFAFLAGFFLAIMLSPPFFEKQMYAPKNFESTVFFDIVE